MRSIIFPKILGRAMSPIRRIIPGLLFLHVACYPVLAADSWDLNYRFQPGVLSADNEWTPALSYSFGS